VLLKRTNCCSTKNPLVGSIRIIPNDIGRSLDEKKAKQTFHNVGRTSAPLALNHKGMLCIIMCKLFNNTGKNVN